MLRVESFPALCCVSRLLVFLLPSSHPSGVSWTLWTTSLNRSWARSAPAVNWTRWTPSVPPAAPCPCSALWWWEETRSIRCLNSLCQVWLSNLRRLSCDTWTCDEDVHVFVSLSGEKVCRSFLPSVKLTHSPPTVSLMFLKMWKRYCISVCLIRVRVFVTEEWSCDLDSVQSVQEPAGTNAWFHSSLQQLLHQHRWLRHSQSACSSVIFLLIWLSFCLSFYLW